MAETGTALGGAGPHAVAVAEAALSQRDPVLAALIARHGPCTLGGRRRGSHFERLVWAIVSQQLSGRAAAAIWRRLRAAVGGRVRPEAVVAAGEGALRLAGLSGAKTRCVVNLAARVTSRGLRLAAIARSGDDDVVAALTVVPGIGRWTAEMFLMFQLGRLDVWPTTDLGVRRGFALAYGLDELPAPTALEVRGEAFRPWRSVVAWYCWQAVEAVPPPP